MDAHVFEPGVLANVPACKRTRSQALQVSQMRAGEPAGDHSRIAVLAGMNVSFQLSGHSIQESTRG